MTSKYESPLSSRYASEYMLKLFSSDVRYQTWRKLWVALARAEMKNGEECDLLSRLVQEKEFGLTETEMNELLTPSLYIGRCSEQVEAFIDKIKPLIADVPRETAEINL